MRPEFIFMLTHADRTVADAVERVRQLPDQGLRIVGFKDVGLPLEDLSELADAIRARGWETALEVVSTSREAELRSVAAALDLGVDWLLGGTHVNEVLPLLAESSLRYCPFAGIIEGHPSRLRGTLEEIVASARSLTARDGVHGLDLLAYRWNGDGTELAKAVCAAISKPVIAAGGIDSEQRIEAISSTGIWGFTVGTAAFDGKFAGGGSLREQVDQVIATNSASQILLNGTNGKAPMAESQSLYGLAAALHRHRWVDLTHAFHPGIPHCGFFEAEKRVTLYHYDEGVGTKGAGFLAHEYHHVGQWGTHVDPPAHFIRGLRFQDDIPVKEMILPLVVLDVHRQVDHDPDYQVTLGDVRGWERSHGAIPEGAFVALRTGWSARWPDAERMKNEDSNGIMHFPGWSQEVLEYLYEVRRVTATGHDTTDTDPGITVSRREAPLEAYVLGLDKWQIELLTNLDQVPQHGALIVASWPKAYKGSGFPARVFAICES